MCVLRRIGASLYGHIVVCSVSTHDCAHYRHTVKEHCYISVVSFGISTCTICVPYFVHSVVIRVFT